jgi:hypothetical protein
MTRRWSSFSSDGVTLELDCCCVREPPDKLRGDRFDKPSLGRREPFEIPRMSLEHLFARSISFVAQTNDRRRRHTRAAPSLPTVSLFGDDHLGERAFVSSRRLSLSDSLCEIVEIEHENRGLTAKCRVDITGYREIENDQRLAFAQ